MEIAVMLNQSGETTGFEFEGQVVVYEKSCTGWNIARSLPHSIQEITNAEDLRAQLHRLGDWLGDCKILVVSRIRGIQYLALENHQISLLQIPGKPDAFLDAVCECGQHQRVEDPVIPMEHTAIFEQRPGYYYADLRTIMGGKTSFNSKQLLIPFFRNETFNTLELLCEHIPRWFEKELPVLGLSFTTEVYKSCTKIFVRPHSNQ